MLNRSRPGTPILLGSALFAFFAPQAFGQNEVPRNVSGSAVFKTYCAVCHGKEAKGDGPLSGSLRFTPPDLTLVAKRNGGTFPSDLVFRMIDGRKPLKGHGGPDMPIWGDAFKGTADGYSEASVKAKIDALVEFLQSVQEKEK